MKTTIRLATQADAYKMTRYIKKILGETPYMISEASEYEPSIEDEEYWIKQTYQDGGMILLAFSGRSLVGMLNVNRQKRNRRNHVCSFGISVTKNHQGSGIGKELMRRMIDWCKNERGLEKITLEVFSNNDIAIQLYEKLGFIEEGRMQKEIRYETGEYADMITMALFL
ncbi:N-acetyltransferase family protein [Metabacillus sp. 84]|uniref:GNAT family N-acetyltransferase n=1 Tax=unclassified Metabacillus TaxID=2675274 RepID=UPI003CEDCF9E